MVKSYIRLATTQGESIMQTVIYSMGEKLAIRHLLSQGRLALHIDFRYGAQR